MRLFRIHSSLLFLILIAIAGNVRGQARGLGAGALILDDNHGHTVSITIPTMTGTGPYSWILPITQDGVPLVFPTGNVNNSTIRWDAPSERWLEDLNVTETNSGALAAVTLALSGSLSASSLALTTPLPVNSGGTGTTTDSANTVFAGPADSGVMAAPSFRKLTVADLPLLTDTIVIKSLDVKNLKSNGYANINTDSGATNIGNQDTTLTLTGSNIDIEDAALTKINVTSFGSTSMGNATGSLKMAGSHIDCEDADSTTINTTSTGSTSIGNTSGTLTLNGLDIDIEGWSPTSATTINTNTMSQTQIGNYTGTTITSPVYLGAGSDSITNVFRASAFLSFSNTAGQSSSDLTITIPGAPESASVFLGVPNGSVSPNSCYTAWVSAANTVSVRFNNYSSLAIHPASGIFTVTVIW